MIDRRLPADMMAALRRVYSGQLRPDDCAFIGELVEREALRALRRSEQTGTRDGISNGKRVGTLPFVPPKLAPK